MPTNRRIDPRIRALGKARIDVTRRARDEQEWQKLWHEPRFPFAFEWGAGAKSCIQYVVEDFAAEVGFYIDVLGFEVSAFSASYAQFTAPDGEVNFGVVAAPDGHAGTPPETLRIQFSIRKLHATLVELEHRGILFEVRPDNVQDSMPYAVLRSPHGVGIELLGQYEPEPIQPSKSLPAAPQIRSAVLKYPEPVQPPAVVVPLPVTPIEDSLVAFWEDPMDDDEDEIEPVNEPAPAYQDQTEAGIDAGDDDEDEVTYEDIEEPRAGVVEPTYEDIDDDEEEEAEKPSLPVPVPVLKPRQRPAVPPARPVTTARNLDVPLPPTRLNRSRRNRPHTARDERDSRH